MQNRAFFPQVAFDQWIVDGVIDLRGSELVILAEGRRYELVEAVHVPECRLKLLVGGFDAHHLSGMRRRRRAAPGNPVVFCNSMLYGDEKVGPAFMH